MIVEAIAVFGNVGTQCSALTGEAVLPFLLQKQYKNGLYYYYQGHSQHIDSETGTVVSDRTPGWVGIDSTDYGVESLDSIKFIEDTKWIHFPSEFNRTMPNITPLTGVNGTTTSIAKMSNVYLIEGTLVINNREFTGPTPIRVKSGDVIAQANTDFVALLFS